MMNTSIHFKPSLIIIVVIGCLVLTPLAQECCEDYCYEQDSTTPFRPQYRNLGQRNSYDFIKGSNYQIFNIEGCEAEKLWTLVRHGTRYPSPESMLELETLEDLRDEVIRLYNENTSLPENGRLCNNDLQLIKDWSWDKNITARYDEFLTVSGWNEIRDIALVYKSVFPALIENSYSPAKFLFRHTDYQRTEGSFKAFAEGLFGEGAYNSFTIDPPVTPSMLLNPMDLCQTYTDNIIRQNGPDTEMTKFRETEIFQKLRSDVSKKLGIAETLDDKTVLNIYEMCRFDKAWFPLKPSAWCAALTQSQFKILEYHEDLELYMKTSYGHDVNLKLSCTSIDDMVNHLRGNSTLNVVAYFAHIDNIHAHLTAMGAFRDTTPLRSDGFETMANRKWKTSEICPFSSNIAAVKYHCPNDVEETEKVRFFLNQKVLNLDWCDGNGICKLSEVLKQYSVFTNGDCDQIFCSKSGRLNSGLMLVYAWLFIMFSNMVINRFYF
ncbi:multiple inositol polyphosphate phosphatase 1-like [Bradysia coprophila]|uniref:multiple inositol polyphosphate phosphatase 1-like n=1 Tax=Bradysia coprophila TaxID=38358 RepID=UPI00187D78A3|nr:multiple inositol polyphosphate phosphatase 1-like [Bradysia coprophila]